MVVGLALVVVFMALYYSVLVSLRMWLGAEPDFFDRTSFFDGGYLTCRLLLHCFNPWDGGRCERF